MTRLLSFSTAFTVAVLLSRTTVVRAHSGPPYPILSNRIVGAYDISIWSDPDSTDDKTAAGKFWVVLEPASRGGSIPSGTRANVTIRPLDRPGQSQTGQANPVDGSASRQFVALAHGPRRPVWRPGHRRRPAGPGNGRGDGRRDLRSATRAVSPRRLHFPVRRDWSALGESVAAPQASWSAAAMTVSYNARMQRPIERVVDLLDPRVNQLHNVDVAEARRRVLSGRSGGRPRDRRIVRARHGRRDHGPDGALAGSADAVFPGEAARGSGAARRGSHRHRCSARSKTQVSRPVSSQLHPHGAGPLHRRARAGRLSRSGSDLHAVFYAGARNAVRRISTRSAGDTSARCPTRLRSG